MSTRSNSIPAKACCFCNLTENNELEYGKFHEHNGIVTHYYCLLLSSNMEQKGQDNEGILGFLAEDIQKELRRGRRLKCSYCNKIGATLGCCNTKCKRIFHFPCGLKAGSLHQFFGEFKSFCVNHRPKQIIDDNVLKEITSKDNVCYICYDKVIPNDFVETLWAPCCKRDAWFHRKCVQQLAMSAGYFFKCPLCNNKKDFLNAMQQYGIFVPSQDASWELVPNAFEELLYRHNQCDARSCQCPKGRKYTSSNAKWELVLCRTCGSQGIHMACGQLKWVDPIWDCDECNSILHNAKDNEHIRSNNTNGFDMTESDSDSDTDISVGTELPVSYASLNFNELSRSSSSNSLSDSPSEIKLRPGPRSFKLQQQMRVQQINKASGLTCSDVTSIPQRRKEENDVQENDKQTDTREKSIQTNADVITLDSDDDNDDVKIILSKRVTTSRTSLQPFNKLVTDKSTRDSDAASIHLPETSSIHREPVSEPEIASASTYLRKSDATLSQESTPKSASSKNEDAHMEVDEEADAEMDAGDQSPIMNIKITNVTSLPPEVFESAPYVISEDVSESSADAATSTLGRDIFEKRIGSTLPLKRGMPEDNNWKKIKKNYFDTNCREDSSIRFRSGSSAAALDTSTQENGEASLLGSEIREDLTGDPNTNFTSTYASGALNSPFASKKDSLEQSVSMNACTVTDSSPNYARMNYSFSSLQNCNERLANPFTSCHSAEDGTSYNAQSGKQDLSLLDKTTNAHSRISKCTNQLPHVDPYPVSSLNSAKDQRNNEASAMCAAPLSAAALSQTTNNTTVNNDIHTVSLNNEISLFKIIDTTVNACLINNNERGMQDKHKTVSLAREQLNATISSPGDGSPTKILCDGDAGTSCAETKSSGQRKRKRLPDGCSEKDIHVNDNGGFQNPSATHNVFLQVTSNYNTCHHPRLIPQYMDLEDLKFRTCGSDNVQMVLYDTFSVNIPVENPKEGRKRSACLISSKEHALIPRARGEASSSVDYVAEQRIDKFYRSMRKENHLMNDKTKYITRSHDDTKENLDPFQSNTLSHNDMFNNTSLMNDNDNGLTPNDYIRENDNEMQHISSDTNLSTFNRRVYNVNVDNSVADGMEFVRSDCKQSSRVNLDDVQVSVSDVVHESKEKRTNDDRSFCQVTNLDLRIVSNKSIESALQDNIVFFMNKHTDDDREAKRDYTDDSLLLWNDKYLTGDRDITRPKAQRRSAARAANIACCEHNIANAQTDTRHLHDAEKFARRTRCHEKIENPNSESKTKRNVESHLKISIDLCKIQDLIDSKPDLFLNRKHNNDVERHKSIISGLHSRSDTVQQQQQVRHSTDNGTSNDNVGRSKQINGRYRIV